MMIDVVPPLFLRYLPEVNSTEAGLWGLVAPPECPRTGILGCKRRAESAFPDRALWRRLQEGRGVLARERDLDAECLGGVEREIRVAKELAGHDYDIGPAFLDSLICLRGLGD